MSNEKQQTGVDFIIESLINYPLPQNKEEFINGDWKQIYEEAKEIEKQKIKKTYIDCLRSTMINPLGDEFYEPQAEEYYQNEFGGNK
jgi:hypothetical protein